MKETVIIMRFIRKSNLCILFLSLNLSLCYGFDCTFGKEVCSCEYIDCKVYKKILKYCDPAEYNYELCASTDYYLYSTEFCNLTSVSCLEIHKANYIPDFDSLLHKQVKYNLTIRYKNFTILKESYFRELYITTLDMAYNHIEQIDENAFALIYGLKELNISINKLEQIKLNSLCDLEVLDASRNTIKSVTSETFSAMPQLICLILRYNDIEYLAGDAFKNNVQLKKIDLKSNYIIKLNSFPVLSRMFYIDLDENEIVSISSGTFRNLESLRVLKIRNNNIIKVDDGAFAGLNELRRLSVSNSKLKDVILLNNSVKLGYFAMAGNSITKINHESFSNFRSLVVINFIHNNIELVDDFAFDLPNLTRLDLSGNSLSKFNSSDVFYGLKSLTELTLVGYYFAYLTSFAFKHLANLSILNLRYNNIECIQENAFFGLRTLQLLILKQNHLKTLNSSGFMHLSNVSALDLDSNKITSIKRGAFWGMFCLTVLKLSENRLSFIKGIYFANLTKLRELYLSNNQISSIQVNSFNTLSSLAILDLNDNSIFALDPRLFNNLASLEKLHIQNNVIHCITNQTFVYARRLTELNLSYNLLTLLTPGLFSALSNLKSLNLEKNPISKIYFDCFANLTNLSSLKIANDITQIEILPYSSILYEHFLPKLDSIFFYKDGTEIIMQFNLTSIRTISLDYCEIDLSISSQLMFENIERITMKELSTDSESITKYIGEFGLSLLEIDLSFNMIEFYRPNQYISNSINLENLRLAGVYIQNLSSVLDISVFSKLVLLDLSFNLLEVIRESDFKSSFELRHLNLSHNNIREVEDYSFFRNSKLFVLDLSYNEIEDLTNDVFAVVYYDLTHFFLNDNRLNKFSADYRLLSTFDSIRIDNNNLTGFPSSIYFTVMNVNSLSLSGNPIGILKPAFFFVTNRILNLYLSDCSIYLIENDTFKKVHTLFALDLSSNQIKSLDKNIFSETGSLISLNLSNNQLFLIQKELFEEFTSLETLVLTSNQINNIEANAFVNLSSVKIMKLDMNPIVDLFTNDTFTGLFQLKFMIVSSNVSFNSQTIQSIINQTHQRMVREVLNIKFFDSIEISSSPDYEIDYSSEMCSYISYFIKNQISFNLQTEDGAFSFYADKYVDNCKNWITDYYQETLDD